MTRILHLAIACSLAPALCATRAHADADIQNLGESDTLLIMQFTSAQSAQTTITFIRGDESEPWTANLSWGSAGIIFGGSNATYAGPSVLRGKGISATQALQTFHSSIANRPFDDITIFRLYAGDIAVALWQEQVVTEIWFVGTMVSDLLIPGGPASTCQHSLNACCKIKTIGTQEYPWPSTSNCVAAINHCGNGFGAAACACLSAACAFCWDGTPDPLCEDVQGLETLTADACAKHTEHCPGGIPELNPDAATELLGVILDRAQIIRDIG